jgi:hypothetical protein
MLSAVCAGSMAQTSKSLTSTGNISEKGKGEILLTAGGGSAAQSRPNY